MHLQRSIWIPQVTKSLYKSKYDIYSLTYVVPKETYGNKLWLFTSES